MNFKKISIILFVIAIFGLGSNLVFRINPKLLRNNLLGQVGVFVGVEQNPYNRIAQQLEKKEEDLTRKEAELKIQEEVLKTEGARVDKTKFYTLLGIAGVLLILIGANFYFDRKRRR